MFTKEGFKLFVVAFYLGSLSIAGIRFLWRPLSTWKTTDDIKTKHIKVNETIVHLYADSDPWPVLPGDPHGIAFLFKTVRSFAVSNTWERWLRDAFDWIHNEGLEDASVPPNKSSILRTFINYSPSFSLEAIKEFFPPMLQTSLIDNPEECYWGNLNPCDKRLFEVAYREMRNAAYFILVSPESAPLLPFRDLYQAVQRDTRIRTQISTFNFTDGIPKTSSWRAIPRKLVQLLLEDNEWTEKLWLHSGKLSCGPDECLPGRSLRKALGARLEKAFVLSPTVDSLASFMVDCWPDHKECEPEVVGKARARYPYYWDVINAKWLDELLYDPNRWFLRKVSDDTTVEGHGRLDDYLSAAFNSSYKNVSIPLHPKAKEKLPYLKSVESLEQLHEALRKAKPFGLKPDK